MSDTNPYASPESDAPSGNPLQVPAFVLLLVAAVYLTMWIVGLPLMTRNIQAVDTSASGGGHNVAGQTLSLVGIGPAIDVADDLLYPRRTIAGPLTRNHSTN